MAEWKIASHECGCEIIAFDPFDPDSYVIEYCPRHAAAPEMLEALESLTNRYIANPGSNHEFVVCISSSHGKDIPDHWRKAQAAIELATGDNDD